MLFLKKVAIIFGISLGLGFIGSVAPMRVMSDDIAATYAGAALGVLGLILGVIVGLAVVNEIF
jgi:hypothetical protein